MLNLPEQLQQKKEPRQAVLDVVQPHFDFDVSKRITLRSDVNQFRYLEDSSVYAQARQGAEGYTEVYWDEAWVCDYKTSFTREQFEYVFLRGFQNAYEQGLISLTEEQDEVETFDEKHHKKVKEYRKMSERTPEEKLAKQAILEILDDDKKEVEKRRKERK